MKNQTFVVSLGGSVIVSSHIQVEFIRQFRSLVESHKNSRFILICGGGKTCRDYQKAAREIVEVSDEDLDWIGVHSTRLNAQLLMSVLRDIAHPKVLHDPNEPVDFKEKVLIASGWRPGWSTDYVATCLAKRFEVTKLVNITRQEYVFDKNPDEHKDAKPIHEISWTDFRAMFGSKWSPGLNVPFDPVASELAHNSNISVIMVGSDIDNLTRVFESGSFKGTVIV